MARSARCVSRVEAAFFVVVRRRTACPLTSPHDGGARNATLAAVPLSDYPPDWLAATTAMMIAMMIVRAMDANAMMVKTLPNIRPMLTFCSLLY